MPRLKITYLVNFFFEALLEHLVCLVEDDGLEGGEVDVAALDVIKHTAARTHEEVDAASQRPRLVLDVHATVDRQRLELPVVVLQLCQLVLNLNKQEVRKSARTNVALLSAPSPEETSRLQIGNGSRI